MPGLERHAAVPRAEVRRPAGRALPRRRRAVGRLVGRLLLGLRDLLAGLPAGREDRRDQRPGARQAQAPEGHPAARPDHHPPDVARARGHAGRRRSPTCRSICGRRGSSARSCSGSTATRRRRGSPAGASRAGRASTPVPRPAARSSTSTAAAPSTTSRGRARRSSRSSSTTASRSSSPSRTAAGCRCSRAACSTTRARSCCGWRAALAPYVRDDGHDHRRQRDQLHADAQARGARDPRRSRTIPTSKLVSERTYDICELLLELHDRGELQDRLQAGRRDDRLPRAVPAAGPLDRQAGARAAGADPRPARCTR